MSHADPVPPLPSLPPPTGNVPSANPPPFAPVVSCSDAAADGAPAPPPPLPEPAAALESAAAPAPPIPPPPPAPEPFRFHGRADEYFRIWIVNTLLTLLTGGLFLAWAKVRKRRYLRGCTQVLGHRFDYRANPVRLLVGHGVMAVLFLGYSLFGGVYPVVRYGVIAVAVVLLPWIVVRSLSFNAYNTQYRGLRFRFHPSFSAAALVYLLEAALIVITLGLYYPAWMRSKRRYVITQHRLGDAYFRFDGNTGPFYVAYFVGGAIVFCALLIGGVFLFWRASSNGGQQPDLLAMIPFFVVYGLGLLISRHFVHAQLFNHVWNHTRLDDHQFQASMKTGEWLKLQLVNLGAIALSLGLLYPWAVVRAHRYTASCLAILPAGSVETIARVGSSRGSATGDSAAEFVGLDFGL